MNNLSRRRRMNVVLALALAATWAAAVPGRADQGSFPNFPTPGPCVTGLAFDGTALWAADRKTDSLYRIDPASGKVLSMLASPGFIPWGIAWDGTHLWCVDAGEGIIAKVDPASGVAVHGFGIPWGRPTGLCWDGTYLWLASGAENKIFQISPEDGTEITSFRAPGDDTQGLSFDGKHLWAADRSRDEIYMLDPADGDVIAAIRAPGPYVTGLAWNAGGLFAADFQEDRVYRIDLAALPPFERRDPRREVLTFTHEVRNYGPGEVLNLEIFLAIPENQPGQDIVGAPTFNPSPDAVVTDRWGQNIAVFRVSRMTAPGVKRVSMEVKAVMYDVRYNLFPDRVQGLDSVPADIRKLYLEDNGKYRITDPVIREGVAKAVVGKTNPLDQVRAIRNYVIDHVDYELAGGWNIAPAVLRSGKGSCSEFTFVFIAMCRAAGIPARYAGAVTAGGDDAGFDEVFHRWAEVYLPGYGWVPVDPSAGDQPSPAGRAATFGRLNHSHVVTTLSGGASEYLKWDYNSNDRYQFKGAAKVVSERIGEWSPFPEETGKPPSPPSSDAFFGQNRPPLSAQP